MQLSFSVESHAQILMRRPFSPDEPPCYSKSHSEIVAFATEYDNMCIDSAFLIKFCYTLVKERNLYIVRAKQNKVEGFIMHISFFTSIVHTKNNSVSIASSKPIY